MNKKNFFLTISLSSAAIFTLAVATPLILNSQTHTSLISSEPQIQLSNLNSVDKTITKGSSNPRLDDYVEFKVLANILNKINNIEPVFSWFERTLGGVDVPVDFSQNLIYERGPTPNVLKINANGLSNTNPSSSFFTRNFFCRVTYNETIVNNSNIASLNLKVVTSLIEITKQPESISNAQTSQTLSVVASIQNPIAGKSLTYQWYQVLSDGNTLLVNQTENFLVVNFNNSELLANTSKSYICELKYDGLVKITRTAVVSTLPSKINIDTQPDNVVVNTNKTASLLVMASTENLIPGINFSYQWYQVVNNKNILVDGQTTNILSLLFDNQQMNDSSVNYYFCRVIYGSIFVDSNYASVTINAPSFNIKQQPQGFNYSTTSNIYVDASIINPIADQNLTYQWYEIDANGNNVLLTNETNFSMPISYSGNILTTPLEKKYFCELTYNGIKLNSSIAIVKILGSTIDIVSQPQNIDVATSTSKLSVSASVKVPVVGVNLVYQWYQIINNIHVPLTNETTDTLSLNYTESQLNSSAVNLYFCKITYGNLNLDTNIATVRIASLAIINAAITQFNSKSFSDKMTLYRALFNEENIMSINEDVKLASPKDLIAQTTNNIIMTYEEKNEIQNKMLSNPIVVGSNGNILFTFDFLNQSNNYSQFSYFINNDLANTCNFAQILTSQIVNLEIIYLDNYFGINITLNSSTIKGLTYSVLNQASRTFNNKQNISFTGVLSNTFNNLIKSNLLNV